MTRPALVLRFVLLSACALVFASACKSEKTDFCTCRENAQKALLDQANADELMSGCAYATELSEEEKADLLKGCQ